MLNVGDKVTIYSQPLTEENPEGDAILREQRIPDRGDGLSIWLVEFENEPGALYQRTVLEPQ